MTAPGAFSSGDVLTAVDMNALPAGLIDYSIVTTDSSLSGPTAVTIHSLTIPTVSGRQYAVFANGNMGTFSSACEARIDINLDSTRTFIWRVPVAAATFHSYTLTGVFDGTGSSITVTVDASVSTGTAQHRATGTYESTAFVVDVGAI